MSAHPIPNAALDDRLGFIGTSGSGKTYNAGTAVEILIAGKRRVVTIDPLGVWWGLRLLADGKKASPFNVVIFGGPHGDLSLTESAGALIGETSANMAESCIIDLSELKTRSAERRFMVAFLETIYRSVSGEPFHLVVDESDLFAPQKPQKGDEVLLGHMENIVRRGRVKGFIPWLISQRPAVLNKNVLSQVDGLLAFKLTAVQDRDALDSWIEGQADKGQGKAIKDSLPTLQIGQGVVWLPGHGILKTTSFPQKVTFDSSRRPKRGEKKQTKALQPLDLASLKQRLSTVEAEAKANDPKTLRAEIAELRKQLAKMPAAQRAADPQSLEAEYARGREHGWNDAMREHIAGIREEVSEIAGMAVGFMNEVADFEEQFGGRIKRFRDRVNGLPNVPAKSPPRQIPSKSANIRQNPSKSAGNGAHTPTPRPVAAPKGDRASLGPERRPLAVLAAFHPGGMTETQWRVGAGMKDSGTWSTYKSRLRTAGFIEERGGLWFITEAGSSAIGANFEPMPAPGQELIEFWGKRVGAAARMLRVIADAYPRAIMREEVAERLDMAESGTFSTYLSRLRSPGLIEVLSDRSVRLSPSLMGFDA